MQNFIGFANMVQLKDDIYLEAATSKNIVWDTFRAAGLNSLNVKILNTILLNWIRLHTKKAHTDHTNQNVLEYHPCEDHYDDWSIKISDSKENTTNDFCFRLTAITVYLSYMKWILFQISIKHFQLSICTQLQ